MMGEISKTTRRLLCLSLFISLSVVFVPVIKADPLKPVPGEFTVVLQGFDPVTGELIFEGFKTGPLPGLLSIKAALTRQTGMAVHLVARWTLTTPWGETMDGENTAVVNTASLHFREHGLIVDATGSLTERIGNFVVIHGVVSDVDFIPGVTEATAHVTIVPSRAKK